MQRNRAKRRLRAAAGTILPLYGRVLHDYVLVARVATLTRPFALLVDDLTQAVSAAHAALDRRRTGTRSSVSSTAAQGKGGEIGQ